MSSATALSLKDRAVLGALFDPEASLDRSTNIQDLPSTIPSSVIKAEQSAVRLLNTADPSQEDISTAISRLSAIITTNPTYTSAYNNRAQAYRLQYTQDSDTLSKILNDLTQAIFLSTPSSPFTPVSTHDARVLSSAHTHRGYLLLRASSSTSFFELLKSTVHELMNGTDQVRCEELASRDFGIAGRYGHKTAQSLSVKTNPYAKLCGQIVKEALQREITMYYEGTTP